MAARAYGLRVHRITLQMLGGVTETDAAGHRARPAVRHRRGRPAAVAGARRARAGARPGAADGDRRCTCWRSSSAPPTCSSGLQPAARAAARRRSADAGGHLEGLGEPEHRARSWPPGSAAASRSAWSLGPIALGRPAGVRSPTSSSSSGRPSSAFFVWNGANQSLRAERVQDKLRQLSVRGLTRRALPGPRRHAAGRGPAPAHRGRRPGARRRRPRRQAARPRQRDRRHRHPRRAAAVGVGGRAVPPPRARPLPARSTLDGAGLLEAMRAQPAAEYLVVDAAGPGRRRARDQRRRPRLRRHLTVRGETAATSSLATMTTGADHRRGLLREGDQVQLTDPKGRHAHDHPRRRQGVPHPPGRARRTTSSSAVPRASW